jgi:hypothetical protein
MRRWARRREILAKAVVGPCHDHIADPALPSIAGPANAFHHPYSLRKNGSAANQTMQFPHRFLRAAGANPCKQACTAFLPLVRNPAPMQWGCTQSLSGLNARTLDASTGSSGKTASARLEGSGEEYTMTESAKNPFGLSVLRRSDAREGRQ